MSTTSVLIGHSETYPSIKIHQIFEQTCQQFPDRTAIFENGGSLSFKELNERVNSLANNIRRQLQKHDIVPGSISGDEYTACVLLPNGEKFITTVLALMKLGVAYIPLEPIIPINRIKLIIREAKPVCFISSDDNAVIANNVEIISEGIKCLNYDAMVGESQHPEQPIPISNKNNILAIFYTSGSTGTPKGVKLSHANIVNRLHWQWRAFPFCDSDRIAAKTALVFVDSLTEIFGTLCKGIPLVVIPSDVTKNTELFVKMMDEYSVTKLVTSPSQLRTIFLYLSLDDNKQTLLRKLKLVITSAEALPADLAKEFFEYFPNGAVLSNYYGSTETTGDITYVVFNSSSDVDRRTSDLKVAIGQPVDNCAVFLVDETLSKTVPVGELGEILVSGAHLVPGYTDVSRMADFIPNNLTDLSPDVKERFKTLYRTGDFGKIVDGHVIYEGRRDAQVKISGKRINLNEITCVVKQIEGVEKVVVLNCKLGEGTQDRIVAFFTCKNGNSVEPATVTNHCNDTLPDYMVPSPIPLQEIPVGITGKIDRVKLRQIFKQKCQTSDSGRKYDEITTSILRIVAQSLGLNELQPEDNFFAQGGDSISAVSAIVKLRQAGHKIDSVKFLSAQNLKEVIDAIKGSSAQGDLDLSDKDFKTDRFTVELLNSLSSAEKEKALEVVADCYIRKDAMTAQIGATKQDFMDHLHKLEPAIMATGLSVVARCKRSGRIVGADFMANCEILAPPQDAFEPVITMIGEFLCKCDADFEGKMDEGTWMTALLGGVCPQMSRDDNLTIFFMMEKKVVELCKENKYAGLATVNTHPVTTGICEHFLGFEKIRSHKVKDFEVDGVKPFGMLADNVEANTMLLRF